MAMLTSTSILDVSRKTGDMTVEDITISDDTFALLRTDHMTFLKHKAFLHTMVSKI